MEKIESTFYYNILISKKENLLEIEWIVESSNVVEDVSDDMVNALKNTIASNKVTKLLVNMIKSQYLLSVANYKWYQNTIFSKFNDLKIDKIAYIVPDNLFVHISFIAANEEQNTGNTEVQYFKDYKKGMHWLKE